MNYEDLVKANKSIATTNIKGKEYAEVNQRIKAFRSVFPEGSIVTEMLSNESGVCIFRATVLNADGAVLGTGTAYEKESASFINKTSYIENCETSAVGRALGICGFGIDTSVASYEEVQNAINNQHKTKPASQLQKKNFMEICKNLGADFKDILNQAGVTGTMTEEQYGKAMLILKDIEESGNETERES